MALGWLGGLAKRDGRWRHAMEALVTGDDRRSVVAVGVSGRESGEDDLVLTQADRNHQQRLREGRGHEGGDLLNGGLCGP